MSDPVPIRPGIAVRTDRALQLIELVADTLTSFPIEHGDADPVDIIIVVRGSDGSMKPAWLIGGSETNAMIALAGAILLKEAVT